MFETMLIGDLDASADDNAKHPDRGSGKGRNKERTLKLFVSATIKNIYLVHIYLCTCIFVCACAHHAHRTFTSVASTNIA